MTIADVVAAFERAGFVVDGATTIQQVRIPTMRAPVTGGMGGELRTLGGRTRLRRPGANIFVTIGPRTTNIYRRKDGGGVEFIEQLSTKAVDLEQLGVLLAGLS